MAFDDYADTMMNTFVEIEDFLQLKDFGLQKILEAKPNFTQIHEYYLALKKIITMADSLISGKHTGDGWKSS